MSDLRQFINLRQIWYEKSQPGALVGSYRFVKDAIFINPMSIYNLSFSLMTVDGQEDVVIFSLQTSAGHLSGESKELEIIFYSELP